MRPLITEVSLYIRQSFRIPSGAAVLTLAGVCA